jgi:hypothetical protein
MSSPHSGAGNSDTNTSDDDDDDGDDDYEELGGVGAAAEGEGDSDEDEGDEGDSIGDSEGDGEDLEDVHYFNAQALFAFLMQRAQGDNGDMSPSVREVFEHATNGEWDATLAGEGHGPVSVLSHWHSLALHAGAAPPPSLHALTNPPRRVSCPSTSGLTDDFDVHARDGHGRVILHRVAGTVVGILGGAWL